MELLKHLIAQFTYRIEPNPGGGFIAHPSDPTMPALEAPSREELQQKIRAAITAGLAQQFPGLKLPAAAGQETRFNFHIEHKAGGGFVLHSDDPNAQPLEGSQEQVESHFAEKLLALVEKTSPELRQLLEAQGISGDVKVFVNQKTFTLAGGAHKLSLSIGKDRTSSVPAGDLSLPAGPGVTTTPGENLGALGQGISDAPITPERSSRGNLFLFVLAVLLVFALMYFFVYQR